MDIKTEKTRLAGMIAQAKALNAEAETLAAAGKAAEAKEKAEQVERMMVDGRALRKAIDTAEELEGMSAYSLEPTGAPKAANLGGPGDGAEAEPYTGKSWGQTLLEAKTFKDAAAARAQKMDPVKVGGLKALLAGSSATGGALYRATRETEVIDTARQRPFSILDMIPVTQTGNDLIEFIKMDTRTNNAAIVPETTTPPDPVREGDFGESFSMKPKSNIAFSLGTATIKTIATWVAASRQILADAPQLRGIVDNELTYMLRVYLENLIVSANETGFVGILAASGIQSRVYRTSGQGWTADESISDMLRKMQTDIELEFYEMTGYILNPIDAQNLEIQKGSDEHYVMIYDPTTQRVWRKPVAISNALAQGTALAGNWQIAATIYDREDVQVRVGEPGNFFLENAVAILGELRAGFAVKRPKAIEKATGITNA